MVILSPAAGPRSTPEKVPLNFFTLPVPLTPVMVMVKDAPEVVPVIK